MDVFFWKMFIQVLCLFFNWIILFILPLSCKSSLYDLNINPLSDIWFANIISHCIGCLFILLRQTLHQFSLSGRILVKSSSSVLGLQPDEHSRYLGKFSWVTNGCGVFFAVGFFFFFTIYKFLLQNKNCSSFFCKANDRNLTYTRIS